MNKRVTDIAEAIRKIAPGFLAVSTAAVLIFCGSYFRVFENNELDTLDLRFRLRPFMPVTDKVVIIEIGDDSIKKIGRFPFDRGYHTALVKALSEHGARAIMFDIFFSEPGGNDADFAQAIKAAGNVYLPYVFDLDYRKKQAIPEAGGYIAQSLANLSAAAAGTGHINVIPDPDGKYRRVPLLIKYGGALNPYLSFRLACDFLRIPSDGIHLIPGKYIQCGPVIKIPLDECSNAVVNYAGEWGKFYKHYSYVDILQSHAARLSGEQPVLDLNIFKNKICLVGLTATGTADLHPNPFGPLYPALSIHADIINSILNNRFVTRAPKIANLIILFILMTSIGAAVYKTKPLKGFLALAGSVTIYSAVSILLFIYRGLWVDMFYPLLVMAFIYLASILGMYVLELKRKLLLENELQIAKKIQQSYLPKTLPEIIGFEIAATMHTAHDVGGDLYDFYEFRAGNLGVMIGDVSGKGIPASLFMTTVSGALKFSALQDIYPADVLRDLNLKLIAGTSTNLFVTIFYAVFNAKEKIMAYASGGHLPALHLPKDSTARFLDADDGLPVGMLEGPYSDHKISFSTGDIFVFYTDGITEAMNQKREMYGAKRLLAAVEKNKDRNAQDLLRAIEADVRQFEPKHRQHDDITFIVVKIV